MEVFAFIEKKNCCIYYPSWVATEFVIPHVPTVGWNWVPLLVWGMHPPGHHRLCHLSTLNISCRLLPSSYCDLFYDGKIILYTYICMKSLKTKTKSIFFLTPGPLFMLPAYCLSNQQIKSGGDKARRRILAYKLEIKNRTYKNLLRI